MLIRKRKKFFKIKLWLLVLIFLMIFSGINMAQAQEVSKDPEYIQKIVLCKDILEKDPLRPTNFFFPQDEKVVTWLRFSYNSPDNFVLRWEWISPQGKLYRRGEVEMEAGSYNNYRTWYWINIKGNYASQLPGEWKVRVYVNDVFLAEKNFFIVGTV